MLKFKKMGSDKVPLLLVTANVGSIFEDPFVMLPIWTSEFLQAVSRMDPKFIALHLQEVGGKAYEKSMQYVQDFVQRLCDCPELRLYDKIRIFLDEDFSSPEKFTALGNLYFAHSTLTDLKMWDFELKSYVDVVGKEVNSGNIEKVTTKEKAKFPQHFFPECKWSRKGFLRTRWSIRGTAIEFVNIHLFHDASNLLAMEPFPSVYCRSRRRALRHTLRHLHSDVNAAPYFIFGDFNFRTDTGAVVKKVTEELASCRLQNGANVDSSKLQYRSKSDDRIVLTVGKKEFAHVDHQKIFREPWLQKFDRELESLRSHLFEFPVKFPPTYPFEEDVHLPTHYMKTRCPAWCDRVLLSQSARLLLQPDARHSSRKSVADSDSGSGRISSSDSSPARSGSPARQNSQNKQMSPGKTLEKKSSASELEVLGVPAVVGRKSIADPTALQHAINARVSDSDVSPGRRKLVRNQSEGSPKSGETSAELRRLVDAPTRRRSEYGVIGDAACMGDHKPIYLRVMLQSDRGIVQCCESMSCALCACAARMTPTQRIPRLPTDPDLYTKKLKNIEYSTSHPDKLLSDDQRLKRTRTGSLNEKTSGIPFVEITSADYSSCDGIFVNDIDTTLLSPTKFLDPYTPESVESHTPNADTSNGSDDLTEIIDIVGPNIDIKSNKLTRDRSVSPSQLKSRLDMLLSGNDEKEKGRMCDEGVPELQRLNSRESCKSDGSKKCGLCCFALKCYGFCRRRARTVTCDCSGLKCCTS
ncbi:inositol polyphosphate-5-phosphatase A isoform X1 [Vanessa atalanta]|uniref:inositol polyphosphate-5-phosphatase A isoform X1 n=1 Tax=Vanessa atalanta TaxID=42275 RepID=UPI001FCD03E7|nr:inositol polyphosphate-5-phosphatase A isoform X1 [Vanessa atalanta]